MMVNLKLNSIKKYKKIGLVVLGLVIMMISGETVNASLNTYGYYNSVPYCVLQVFYT